MKNIFYPLKYYNYPIITKTLGPWVCLHCCSKLGRHRSVSGRGMGRRILNDALRTMVNAERRRKATVELNPISTVISSFLQIMKHRGRYLSIFNHLLFVSISVIKFIFFFLKFETPLNSTGFEPLCLLHFNFQGHH